MKLMRTPPVARSALTDAVSNTISCTPVAFGIAPPPQPAADHRAERHAVHHEALIVRAAAMRDERARLGPSAPPTSGDARPPVEIEMPGISTPRLNMLRPVGSVLIASSP